MNRVGLFYNFKSDHFGVADIETVPSDLKGLMTITVCDRWLTPIHFNNDKSREYSTSTRSYEDLLLVEELKPFEIECREWLHNLQRLA